MSLLVWLPLISNTANRGLLNTNITTTGTIAYNAGFLNKALTFNSSAITMNPAPITTTVKKHSFAFWYKTTNASATQCLYNGRTAVGSAIAVFLIGGKFRYDDGAQHTFNYSMTANTWTHVAITRDTSNIKLYINGTLQQTITATDFTCATTTASLGMSSTSGATPGSNAIIGQVNDYRIYDHVLSKKEIKELSKGLTMHMPMDWGGNTNILPDSPVATNPTETDSTLGRTVYVRSTTATGESYIWGGRSDVVEQSTKYTLSAWVWVNEYVKSVEVFWLSTNTTNKKTGTAYDSVTVKSAWTQTPNTWKYVTWTFTTKADDYTGVIRWDNNGSSTSGTAAILKVYNMKIEKGEKATPFVPHKNDSFYNGKGFGDKFKQECSGYTRTVTQNSNNVISCATDSPRGSGTHIEKTGKLTISDCMPTGTFPTFTVNAWLRYTVGATQTLWNDLLGISANNSSDGASLMRLEFSNTTSGSICWYGPMCDSGGMCGTTLGNTGEWHMITLVSNGTNFIGYKDGVQYATKTPDTDARKGWKGTGHFYIGDGTIYYDVADVRVYSTVLSVDDIKELYNISAHIDKSGKIYCNQIVEN